MMKTIEELIHNLKNSDAAIRANAAEQLMSFGPGAKPAVTALVAALEDPSFIVKLWTIRALGAIGTEARGAVPHLVAALEDQALALFAATALGRIGKAARSAVGELRNFLFCDSEEVREAAATALARIEDRADAAIAVLLGILAKGSEPNARRHAASSLGELRAPAAIHVLKAKLTDADAGVRREVACALGRFGASAASAVPGLVALLEDPEDDLVRFNAAVALLSIDPSHHKAKRVLRAFAGDGDTIKVNEDGATLLRKKPKWVRSAAYAGRSS